MNARFIFVMILDSLPPPFKNGYFLRKIMGDMKKGTTIIYLCQIFSSFYKNNNFIKFCIRTIILKNIELTDSIIYEPNLIVCSIFGYNEI